MANKVGKVVAGTVLIFLVFIGLITGIFSAMADTSVSEQRNSIIFGYPIAVSSIIAFACLFNRSMRFRLDYKVERTFYSNLLLSVTLFFAHFGKYIF
jgi:thiamine transporter ThiT